MSLPPAETPALRDYEVSGPLVEGGIVFAGRHRLTGHPVALERIAPELAGAAGYLDRLGSTARQVASLRTPHVVAVYDLVVEDGVHLVLELVAGASLRDLAPAGQPLPPVPALAAVDDVLSALEAAHAAGIVHGDIRPERVLVTPQGIAKLGGFAESQALLVLPNHPGAHRPGYSSPERLAGAEPDARSDLYATAALASELMTGVAPSPGRVGPAALPAVAEVLRRGLAPQVARRYATATELRAALVGAVADSLGPSWRLASDLGPRATAALEARGVVSGVAPAPTAAAETAAEAPPVPGFSTPPPPGAAVLRGGTPPPPLARPPAMPPPSYLPPPQPRARAEITEVDGSEERRGGLLVPLLIALGILIAGAGAVLAVVLLRGSGGGASPTQALQVGDDVVLTIAPQQGECTTTFRLAATGSVTGQGTLTFRWEMSNGGPGGAVTQATDNIPVPILGDRSFRFTRTETVEDRHIQWTRTWIFRIVGPQPRVAQQTIAYSCP